MEGRMNPVVLVGLGGLLGAVSRHLVSEFLVRDERHTLSVNVLGSLALGALSAAPTTGTASLALGVGFCGAFTTFSTFAFQTVRLYERGDRLAAVTNGAANLVGALLAVGAGALLARLLL